MLKTQEFLRSGNTLGDLTAKYGIKVALSKQFPLAILNYDQIESDKRAPVARECRALVLEVGTWEVVARSFPRFFNAGECPDDDKKFDWSSFTAEDKEDGSLMSLFNYRGSWLVTTRGSFALGEIQQGSGKVWEEAFYDALPNEKGLDYLHLGHTYVFEFCSRMNKVVRDYPEPTLFLLSAFHNKTGVEASEHICDSVAGYLGVKRPSRFCAQSFSDIVELVNNASEPTFEGYVLRDRHGTRLKVKNPSYVALHHLKDNGNVFAAKNLVPLLLKGEHAEVLAAFPEAAEKLADVAEKLGGAVGRMKMAWDAAKGARTQKEFALVVTKLGGPLKALLFDARKKGVEPDTLVRDAEDLVVKALTA